MRKYIDDTCEVICEDNGKKVVAEVLSFKERKHLAVSIERRVKVELQWNGTLYEGKMASMSFVSNGPHITEVKDSRR